ncbi:MAG: hypothetical protein H6684_14645 [Deltaproteobacteria bacterium]|nr:hypothetical protein [Deltaproteobacteria bacterium]MCB9478469.1 hypothetical protein [Deltaproteobacteria bacterium]MCB9489968.1 hypothetical protein [Deltaproteobacteria bacterium]
MTDASKSPIEDFGRDLIRQVNELVEKIPGLAQYRGREQMRDQDRLLREHTVKKMQDLKARMDQVKADLLNNGGLALLDDVDRVTSRLDGLMNAHRFAAYGYTGAFDPNQILEGELGKLYEYDLKILKAVEDADTKVASLEAATPDNARETIQAISRVVGELEPLVKQRKDILLSFGS